jgi:hypothetical protein
MGRIPLTAEQKARDLLDRMGVPAAHHYTSGELIELANLIAVVDGLGAVATRLARDVDTLSRLLSRLRSEPRERWSP